MKKINYLILLAVIASNIFTSCRETLPFSVTKRHYRNGYNVEIAAKKPKSEVIQSVIVAGENEKIVKSNNTLLKTTEDNKNQNSISLVKNSSSIKENRNEKEKTSATNKGGVYFKKKAAKTFSKMRSVVNLVSKVALPSKQIIPINKIKNHERAEHPLGGIIWTLICVFFVLWLISLLTGGWGLGAFLHLFLVVALVLILLRLLWVI
ncbi:MAG: hypothetical protein A3F72_06925 [Bacteroidetes bacterium RIFCSPLOWO2_12_FULL_35_15]|nr:MAG: hypothetical protein A3F72_06925 [Bacteroidetes bacterium RIFCSPLOWO2_12_FULL_35_15]